jgi:hypothetical protein
MLWAVPEVDSQAQQWLGSQVLRRWRLPVGLWCQAEPWLG